MKCNSCDGNMVFIKEDYAFSCPFCGAYEKLDKEISDEELEKMVEESLEKIRHKKEEEENTPVNRLAKSLSGLLGLILLFALGFVALILTAFGFSTEPQYIPIGVVAAIQLAAIMGALIVRGLNRSINNKKLIFVENLLITIAMVLILVFFLVFAFI